MNNDKQKDTREIPIRKDPDKTIPPKDPQAPSENNPINPKKDDPEQ